MNINPFTKTNLKSMFTYHPKSKSRVSDSLAKEVGNKLFVDWKKVNVKTLAAGMNVELEHEGTLKTLGVAQKDLFKAAAQIALDHLAEDPQYYVKLKKMEAKK